MRKLNFKHNKSGAIISPACFHRVPNRNKDHFVQVDNEPTHRIIEDYDDESDFASNMLETIAVEEIVSDIASDFSTDSGSMDTSSTETFGGGDFGGAGAGDSW